MKHSINIVTLGCSKNVVDSEKLAARLHRAGYTLVHDGAVEAAPVVVVNTCGFIDSAKEESVNTILAFAQAKQQGKLRALFVMGCLAERYKDELRKELAEVDDFFGVNKLDDVLTALGVPHAQALLGERLLSTARHYAYLKISEGCSWKCSYCAIPLIRGNHVSTPLEQLVSEAEMLAAQGVKELMVVAQDSTYYGLDLYGHRCLAQLLRALSELRGLEWIRLHYAYPAQFPPDLIDELRSNPKLCKYLDIPFQHASDAVLRAMRRGHTRQQAFDLVAQLREQVPNIALRTTLMVGHPGEDEAAFAELLDFVRTARFERLGVFTYSEEEGTYGAAHLADTIPPAEKQRRADELMRLQQGISAELNAARVGHSFRVLIDRKEGDYYIGRTQHDSPEVDGEVLIPAATRRLRCGTFHNVRITGAEEFDLFGEI
ncbi:MAG: 30S ribosomal protein S12 methylthiotransferase RimO [Prevotellaceae bacterium]|jgi:ribosomal protein S12 methylthiotransferase|nr:30S ribosomal protein S12 methylthiotransferase RimO [Prevotellaceae bacterium]